MFRREKKFYVFAHKLDGKVFYYGTNLVMKGKNWWKNTKPDYHGAYWNDIVGNRFNEVECVIVEYFEFADEAWFAKLRLMKAAGLKIDEFEVF